MIKDSFEAKIIRIDGLAKSETTCQIFYNKVLQEEFDPAANQKYFQLSGSGIYTFLFKTGQKAKSVSLNLSLFTDDGAQWLPLYDSQTVLKALPEDTASPRFLIVLCRSKTLHIIEESGEVSEDSLSMSISGNSEIIARELEHCIKDTLESVGSEFMDQSSILEDTEENTAVPNSEKLSRIWEKDQSGISEDKTSFEMFKEENVIRAIFEDLNFKYEKTCKEFEENAAKLRELENQCVKLAENFGDQVSKAKNREEALLKLVDEKDLEIKKINKENLELKSRFMKIEIENTRLKDVNFGLMNQLEVCASNSLVSEIGSLRKTVFELEEKIKGIYDERCLGSENKDSDRLDEAVRFQAKVMNLPKDLVKDKEQVYLYEGVKISLALVNGNLVCRQSGVYKSFQEYMENNVLNNKSFKNARKVDKRIDSEYDEENFKEVYGKQKKGSQVKVTCLKKKNKS